MDETRWQRVQILFAAARELEGEDRDAFLKDECAGDQSLRDDLRSLLEMDGESGPLDETVTLTGLFVGHTVANRFRIVRHVGMGGMGDVYEAEDLQLGERVALKTIRPDIAADPTVVDRFKREILLGKKVTHPNVCRIHDLGLGRAADGSELLFLTMQFLNGETLSARIKRGPVPEAEAIPLIEDMAEGLVAAHKMDVVHRDFKSGNVMLAISDSRNRAVITDFGLARSIGTGGDPAAITVLGAVVGTVGYMAPEQLRGEIATARTDIYALGIVIFEMLTGTRPFTGESAMVVALKHLHEPPPSPRALVPELDPKWDEIVFGCLQKEPGQRFQSAVDVKSALCSGQPLPGNAPPLRSKKRTIVQAVLASALVAALGLLLWHAIRGRPARLPEEQRVAVLEFDNVGGDPANQVFCDGLMETLAGQLTELEQFQGTLSVVPASDVRKAKVTSVREAQKEFGVTLAITGSVQRSPTGVRMNVNVVDARQLKQLRSHGMFIPETDAVAMQQGVITQVTSLLDMQLRPEAQRLLSQNDTPVPGAYDYYLQGAGYLLKSRASVDQAVAEFRHALDRDPNYALAHAGLGEAYWDKYLDTKDKQWIDQAWQECRRSIALAPRLGAAHVTLALLSSGTGHYDEAIRQAQEAIEIDPGDDRAYSELARALDATNQPDAAEATLKKAIALRPGYWNNYVRLGILYINHGKYTNAIDPFTRVTELVPDNPAGYTDLGSTYHLLGREGEAERMLKKSIQVRPTPLAYSNLATVYFFERRYADAVPIFEKVVSNGSKDYEIWGNLGDAYRWTPGNAEKAILAYNHAIELAKQSIGVNPRDARALISLALCRAKTGQGAQALRDMQTALTYSPDDKTILFSAAIVCEIAGRRTRALGYLERAISGGYSLNEIATEPELGKLREDSSYKVAVARNSGQ